MPKIRNFTDEINQAKHLLNRSLYCGSTQLLESLYFVDLHLSKLKENLWTKIFQLQVFVLWHFSKIYEEINMDIKFRGTGELSLIFLMLSLSRQIDIWSWNIVTVFGAAVSHTTDDLIFEWYPEEDTPLVVEPIQLPQVSCDWWRGGHVTQCSPVIGP